MQGTAGCRYVIFSAIINYISLDRIVNIQSISKSDVTIGSLLCCKMFLYTLAVYVCMFACLPACLYVCLSVSVSLVFLSVYMSVCLCPYVCLYVCLSDKTRYTCGKHLPNIRHKPTEAALSFRRAVVLTRTTVTSAVRSACLAT